MRRFYVKLNLTDDTPCVGRLWAKDGELTDDKSEASIFTLEEVKEGQVARLAKRGAVTLIPVKEDL